MAAKTVLITGSSSGIGKACVEAFSAAGWNVAATMRNPTNAGAMAKLRGVKSYCLDVTEAASVNTAFSDVVRDMGRIDVVVNNAGYGLAGIFELMSDEALQRQYDTNVLGLMRVTRSAITHMRERGSGTIIQISSGGGRMGLPLYSPYHGTKFAVEGFSESLQYELRQLGIRVKLIEPGLIKTDFTGRSADMVLPASKSAYDPFVAAFSKAAEKAMRGAVEPSVVAKKIVSVAQDSSFKLRYAVGNPAPLMLMLRKVLPDGVFIGMMRKAFGI